MTSTSRRDSTSSWNSSNFSTPQNREKKHIARREVRSPNKNHHHVWACLQNTRQNYIVSPRDIADESTSLAFEAIGTIGRSYGDQA